MVMEYLTDEVTGEQRPEEDKGTDPEAIWGHSIAGQGNSKYRTEVIAHVVCSGNSKDASWAAGE